MKFIKNFLLMACVASAHMSHTAQDPMDNQDLILTEKEAQLIKTNRVFEKISSILKPLEKARDWSIRQDATTPSKTEAIKLAAPLFAQALQEIMNDYATCYEITTIAAFGLSTMQELCIADNKESGLKIIGSPEFMKSLDTAIELFEVETSKSPFVEYTAKFVIQVTATQSLTLHEIKQAIERVTK